VNTRASRTWVTVLAVPLVLALGVWALATLRLQTELFPLFPQKLPSVQGLAEAQTFFGSAQQIFVVLGPSANEEHARALQERIAGLPAVNAVAVIGSPEWEAMLQTVAWTIANLPPEQFTEFQSLFSDPELRVRVQATRAQLSGAIDIEEVGRLEVDPLGLLPWLEERSRLKTDPPVSLLALVVQARAPLRTFHECQEFVADVRQAAAAALDGAAFHVTGRAAFVAENSLQMRRDMILMMVVATLLVAAAFWLFYRSIAALGWVLCVQALALCTAAFVARILFGELNVLSIGFSSILLGVGMDYCILVHHFHACGSGGDRAHWRTLRHGIWVSAITTAAAFGVLYFSSFPGLQQLAVLVGAGLLATAFFATESLPLALQRMQPAAPTRLLSVSEKAAEAIERGRPWLFRGLGLALAVIACILVAARGHKFYDTDLERLRPSNSDAARGARLLVAARKINATVDAIVSAPSLAELRTRVAGITDTTSLLPQEDYLETNRQRWTSGKQDRVRQAIDAAGFDATWSRATCLLLDSLDKWAAGTEQFSTARLLLSNVARKPDGQWAALVRLPRHESRLESATAILPADWPTMAEDLGQTARNDFRRLSLWMLVAVAGFCWMAHRSLRLVGLNLAALALATGGLAMLLLATGQTMTVLSLLAVPLLVGMTIDITVHLVLALEHNHGDLRATFRQMAAPVTLTGLTSLIGFGAPMITQQPMLQNLGMVMDMGIISAVLAGLIAIPLLYGAGKRNVTYSRTLYRAGWFSLAEALVRRLSPTQARRLGRVLGDWYATTHPRARAAVRSNVQLVRGPNVGQELVRATFRNFGAVMADYFLLGSRTNQEAMAMIEIVEGAEHFKAAVADGKGALLVTGHVGLFELGGVLMHEFGVPAVVLSLREPSPALNRWRAEYRKRWGAETLEVGHDHFSFVEILRQLAQGKCVAMLMDRPYGDQSVEIEFPHGKVPFASGPVWLSLLSGAPLLVVTVVATASGRYRLRASPPLKPQWRGDDKMATVREHTVELAKYLKDTICEHPDQWYQFVPLSPRS
jgi:lauroyl/myristoyl acyltransferase